MKYIYSLIVEPANVLAMKHQWLWKITVIILGVSVFGLPTAKAKKWVVTVKNFSFTPYNLTHVKAHDTIQWVWESGSHSTTSFSIPATAEPWDFSINQDTTSFMYVPTENGTYFYRSTPDSLEGMNGQFTVYGASGADEPVAGIGFSLFPVPFHDQVRLSLPAESHRPLTLDVFNQQGEKVLSIILGGKGASREFVIETPLLPAGVYLFRLSDGRRMIGASKALCRP
jgi:plastocyanin